MTTNSTSTARGLALLGARVVLGGYLTGHGAQKLFGALDGPGLDAAGAGFASLGLTPGPSPTLAKTAAIVGGGLTALSIAELLTARKAQAAEAAPVETPATDAAADAELA